MAGDVRELWIKTELLILALCEKLRRLAFPYNTFYSLSYMKDFSCFFCANCYLFSGEKRINSTILNSTHSENSYQFSSQLFISAGINTEQVSSQKKFWFFHSSYISEVKNIQKEEVAWMKFGVFFILAFPLQNMKKFACHGGFQTLAESARSFPLLLKLWKQEFLWPVVFCIPLVLRNWLASYLSSQYGMFFTLE